MAKYKSDQKLKYKESDEIINFGYVKGMTIGDVIKNEPGFIVWAKKTIKGFKLYPKLIKEHNLNPDNYHHLDT